MIAKCNCILIRRAPLCAFVILAGAVKTSAESKKGERLDPSKYGPSVIETLDQAVARDNAIRATLPPDLKSRNGRQGSWAVPGRRSTYYPLSGNHNVINKWGDTCMGIGFDGVVTVEGAYFAGQAGRGAWTSGVRAIGFRDGAEVGRTEWFLNIGTEPMWFEMNLRDVDRITIESQPVLQGGGWYGMDDLTFTRHSMSDPGHDETVVIDFENVPYNTTLTRDGAGYAGLLWETGSGNFEANQAIHAPLVPPDYVPDREQSGRPRQVVAAGTAPRLPDIQMSFRGAIRGDAGSFSFPPDTHGAIGPSHFVVVVNRALQVYDKPSGIRIQSINLGAFLPGSSGDPRVVFDEHSGRWVVIVTDFNERLYLAVSATDDPTGGWFKTDFLAAEGADAGKWPDYPTLGVDANGIYIESYMVGGGAMTLFVIDKAPLISPNPSLGTITAFRLLPWEGALQPTHVFGSALGQYVVSEGPGTTIRVRLVEPPMTDPTMTELGLVDVESYGSPPDVPALGAQTALDSVGSRLMNAVYRDGSIWTAHTISYFGKAAVRWYEIDAQELSVIQYGTVTDNSLYYFFPTITVNRNGDVALAFSGADSSQYAAAYYTGRRADDPSGAMAQPALLKEGQGPQNLIDNAGRNRFGDYSYTSIDPVDDETFWTIQEYSHGNNTWGTWIGSMTYGDCNSNGMIDACDVSCGAPGGACDIPGCGTMTDCNNNGRPDNCEIPETSAAPGGPFFCRNQCDDDCNANGLIDECESLPDCNDNGFADPCDVAGFVFTADSGSLSPIGNGASQNFLLESPPLATDDVSLTFTAVGDFGEAFEYVDVYILGSPVGRVFDDSGSFCPLSPDSDQIVMDAATFNDYAVFGNVPIALVANTAVNPAICSPTSFISVTVSFLTQTEDVNANGVPDICEPCQSDAECIDQNGLCTVGRCNGVLCQSVPKKYGDVGDGGGGCGADDIVDISDIFAVIDAFQSHFGPGCNLANLDIAGAADNCTPDGIIDILDIFAVLDAFQSIHLCCGQ